MVVIGAMDAAATAATSVLALTVLPDCNRYVVCDRRLNRRGFNKLRIEQRCNIGGGRLDLFFG